MNPHRAYVHRTYQDRLLKHRERLVQDMQAARMRLDWCELEQRIRPELEPGDALMLEAIGVLGSDRHADDEALVARRQRQIDAIDRLIRSVGRRP